MNKKNVLICSICGCVLVAIAFIMATLSNCEDAPWWVGIVLFFLPLCSDFIWQTIKAHAFSKNWYESWRRIKGTGKCERVRISFSYLFRIKIDDKYLLVKNSHGTELFQPVGGVYKYKNSALKKLRKLGAIADDGTVIKMDDTTKHDFRLRVEISKLPRFVRWFQKGKSRETVRDLGREFSEELLDSNILPKAIFNYIEYTYIGQHISNISPAKFDRNIYELFIADIVEINLSPEQYRALEGLQSHQHDDYCFVTEQMILSNKTQCGPDNNRIDIADHSYKILEVTEAELEKRKYQKYAINISS